MKKWRIIYWCGLFKAEFIVKAFDIFDARSKFIELKGEQDIIDIFETFENEHN